MKGREYCICNFAIFVRILMKFLPKCKTNQLGMIYTILGSFRSFLIGKGPIFGLGKCLPLITPFPPVTTFVIRSSHLLIFLGNLPYITSNMDLDETASSLVKVCSDRLLPMKNVV